MGRLLIEFGTLITGTVLTLCGLLLAKRRGWSTALLIGGFWMLALWAFAGQGSL